MRVKFRMFERGPFVDIVVLWTPSLWRPLRFRLSTTAHAAVSELLALAGLLLREPRCCQKRDVAPTDAMSKLSVVLDGLIQRRTCSASH